MSELGGGIAVSGPGECGKNKASEYLQDVGMVYPCSTSEAALGILFNEYFADEYPTREACYEDRRNRREEWGEHIAEINGPTKKGLYQRMFDETGCTVFNGIRRLEELRACEDYDLVRLSVWLEREGVPEDKSLDYGRDSCDLVIVNDGTLSDLARKMHVVAYNYQFRTPRFKYQYDITKKLLQTAYQVAATSPDPSSQNAALLIRDGDLVLASANCYPPGVAYWPDIERNERLARIDHAEVAVIRRAIRDAALSRPGREYDMVMPWIPCSNCAREIIGTGIRRLIVHQDRIDKTPKDWIEDCNLGVRLLTEAGVLIERFYGEVDSVPILCRGELQTF